MKKNIIETLNQGKLVIPEVDASMNMALCHVLNQIFFHCYRLFSSIKLYLTYI